MVLAVIIRTSSLFVLLTVMLMTEVHHTYTMHTYIPHADHAKTFASCRALAVALLDGLLDTLQSPGQQGAAVAVLPFFLVCVCLCVCVLGGYVYVCVCEGDECV